jgi:hypothetical protein
MPRPTDGTPRRNKHSLGNRMQILERVAAASKHLASSPSGSFATKPGRPCHVRFTPTSDRTADITDGPVRANSRPPLTG